MFLPTLNSEEANNSLHSVSPTLGYLVFSETGERTAPETIIYDVQPYSGGIALLHMHVRLKGKKENLVGHPDVLPNFRHC